MQAYFFQKTKDQIMKRSKTNILAEHYDRFFALFGDKTDKDYVDQYVKTAIQDKKFKRMAVDEITLSDKGIRLVREMEKTFYVYDLKMLYYIADILYQFKNYGHFLSYWAERLLKDYYLDLNRRLRNTICSTKKRKKPRLRKTLSLRKLSRF